MTRALVRPPGKTFPDALTRIEPRPPVDCELARRQHAGYVAALRALGVEVTELSPDDRHPDAVFVQDRVCVLDGRAIAGPSAVESRRGEAEPLLEILGKLFPVVELEPPACLDWGDVLLADRALFVGMSERSNRAAVEALRKVLGPERTVDAVDLPSDLLHLLSGCSWLGSGFLLSVASLEGFARSQGWRTVGVDANESASACVISLGEDVIVPAGYPRTAEALRRLGKRVQEVPIGEFEKRDGGATCLSVLY